LIDKEKTKMAKEKAKKEVKKENFKNVL